MRFVAFAAPALAALLLSTPSRAQCSKDLDCSGELICEGGRCVEPVERFGPPRVIVVESKSELVVAEPRFERRSPALIVIGSLAIAAGVGGVLVGLGSMGSTCHYELGDRFSTEHCETSPNYLAYALGAAGVVGGTVLIVVGAKKVAVEPSAQLTPWLSPDAGGLTLRLRL